MSPARRGVCWMHHTHMHGVVPPAPTRISFIPRARHRAAGAHAHRNHPARPVRRLRGEGPATLRECPRASLRGRLPSIDSASPRQSQRTPSLPPTPLPRASLGRRLPSTNTAPPRPPPPPPLWPHFCDAASYKSGSLASSLSITRSRLLFTSITILITPSHSCNPNRKTLSCTHILHSQPRHTV